MKEFTLLIGTVLLAILIFFMAFGISSLIFWGLGNFIIWVFKINYEWTFLHGLATGLVYSILKGLFSRK